MKTSQFSDEQIVQILQQAERDEQTIGAVCRSHGIAEATFYRWRKKFGGLTQNEVQRLWQGAKLHYYSKIAGFKNKIIRSSYNPGS